MFFGTNSNSSGASRISAALDVTMRLTQRLVNNGKVTIPVHIRDELDLEDGDLVELRINSVDHTGEAKT